MDTKEVTASDLGIKKGMIVYRNGNEYEVDEIDEDGVCMWILNDEEWLYVMSEDCTTSK
jgi:hypothetical protein